MKRLFVLAAVAAVLSGCAVVAPYEEPDVAYLQAPAYVAPPAVVYGPPVYVTPPVQFSLGLNYWQGGGWHHGHFHGAGHRGFGSRGFPAGHGAWHR